MFFLHGITLSSEFTHEPWKNFYCQQADVMHSCQLLYIFHHRGKVNNKEAPRYYLCDETYIVVLGVF